MKTFWLGFHLVGSVFAASFDYPTGTANAVYFEGMNGTHSAKFVPGTLENCKINNPTPGPGGLTMHTCDVKGSQLEVDIAGTQKLVVFQTLSVMEYQGAPGVMSVGYYLQGMHGTSLPDGSPYASPASLSLNRNPQLTNKIQGNLSVYNLGINGAVLVDWPAAPTPP